MKYIVMSNGDPLLIVNSEKDAKEYVEEIDAKFVSEGDCRRPRIHFVKCKCESDFAMLPTSLPKTLWNLFLIALYIVNMVFFLMDDSMKSGICMLMCLMILFDTNRKSNDK